MVFGCMDRVALLPCVLVIWSSTAFIASYIFAVLEGHVVPFVPYISDTGTCVPESGLFGFMISVTAILGAATMYTRYKIIQAQNLRISFLNYWFNFMSLFIGVLGCIGMGVVASFQETSVTKVHEVGALMTFICGVAYIFLQSIITFKACPQWNKKGICYVRMTISVISIIAIFPMIICAAFDGIKLYHCTIGEEPSPYHQASAVCEWIVAFGFVTFFLTYIKEFQAVTVKMSIEINDDF
ncbi:DNA damage-regulated autophagy modulator protein 1 [Dendrobates tinctorius]|uniref:DNA damage-regulated autophagy modulator protein 1 n=1 Tax=Dendrobates tinctorius TaxID=92724 RepID=UPI003CCA2BFD